jgi:hypothetical protein
VTPRREWAARLFLILGSTCAVVAAIEGLARIVVWNWSREPNAVRRPFARFDPELGWSKPPGAKGVLRRSEYRALLEINSHGNRGPEIPVAKPPGMTRILLLGDSFTEGYTVEEAATVRARVERGLTTSLARPVQVINGGTAGYGTDQEFLYYLKAGRLYSPDLVLLLFYYNDLYRDGDLRIQPWFELDSSGALVLRNSPVPKHREFYRADPYALKPYKGSVALALLQPRLVGHPRVASFLSRAGLAEKPVTGGEVPEELHPFGRQRPREVRNHWARFSALLKELKTQAGRDGAPVAAVYVPARFEIDDNAWLLTREAYGLNAQWDRNRVADDLFQVTSEIGVPLADPRPALRSREARGQTYFPEDGHWTEAGNEVVAAEILRLIARHDLLPVRR